MKSSLLTFFILLTLFKPGFSEVDPCHKSTEGTDFWFGFMENRWYSKPSNPKNAHYIAITVTAREETDFTVTYGPSEIPVASGHVNSNSSVEVRPDWNILEARGTQSFEDKAIHVVAQKPVNVYAFNYCENSSDVAVIYPVVSLGNEYYTMCSDPHVVGNSLYTGNGRNSEFLIVATADDTKIDITPSKIIDGTTKIPADIPYQITLNKGQMYQAQSENVLHAAGEGDLTGTYIRSDKPIAVYSGALATTVPGTATSAWDHLYDQLPPIQSWGKEFYTVPLKDRGQDLYRILSAEDALVNVENYGDVLVKKGIPFEFILSASQPSRIYSNKKIMVAQFSESNSEDPQLPDGDPFVIILSPVTQTVNDVTFVAFYSEVIKKTYVNIVSKTDQISNLLMDESPAFRDQFKPYKNNLYSYAQIEIPKGTTHRLRNTDPKQGLLATVYGFGGVESFGYGVGFNLDYRIELPNDTIINGRKTIVRCLEDDSLTLKAYGFDKYLWSTSKNDTLDFIKVKGPGTYSVSASIDECVSADTIDVKINQPVLTLGNDTVVCNPDSIHLDAGLGWKNILWSPNNEKTQIISPKLSGEYSVQVVNRQGCKATGSIKVLFQDRPKINPLQPDTLFCGKKSALINLSADKGTYTLERADTNEKMQGMNASVPVYGSFPFKFTATDQYGCATDTTFKLGFHKIPTIVLSIDSTTCYHYNLTANYKGDAPSDVSRFTWVFAGDTIADGIGIDSDTIPLGINQSKRDLSLRVIQDGCANSDTIKDIKVIPNLSFQVVDSVGCQPFSAEFIARNSEKVFYDWNFGDGIIRRLSDHPTWTYEKDGYYDVHLKVTTDKGCTNSVKIDSAVYVAPIPTAGFSQDLKECLDLNNHQLSYFGTGDQKDKYNWDLSAFDPEEIIQNPGTTQGPFIFNLKNKPLVPVRISVISKYLCKSDTAKVMVSRIPSFLTNITDNKGCAPLQTSFQGIQADPVDQITYKWNFGDGTSASGSNVSHSYDNPDHWYNIKVTALSALTGCSSDFMKDSMIFAYPKPKSEFAIDHSIVYTDKPEVRFENQSLNATHYLWNFGESITSTDKDPSYKFKGHGYKKVLLEAFNDFECSDTISQNVLVAFSRIFPPNAFSPNASNVQDREFKLSQEAIRQEGYHLSVFSRWDDLVFETKNEIKGWDGKLKNGNYAPAGSYVWVLDFVDFLGRTHRQTGTVTLIY